MNHLATALRTTLTDDLEPSVAAMLDRKREVTGRSGDYRPVGVDAIVGELPRFLHRNGVDATVDAVAPMGGGASNEQYVVTLRLPDDTAERVVLRIDAVQGVMESDRQREFDVLRLLAGRYPVPAPRWVEPTGSILGRPFLATAFVHGVTAPSSASDDSVSGMQTTIGGALRETLAEQFVDNLVALHSIPVAEGDLGTLGVPDADPHQAARWQVNWWTRVWHDDAVTPFPLISAIALWLRHNLPTQDRLVLVHGDYRTGNYLFDESTQKVTAVLDWELSHVGDPHEDLAWGIQRLYSTVGEDGQRLVTGLMTRKELLARYADQSGHPVCDETLHFYEVLCAFKSLVATLGSSVRAARDRQSHQDVLLTWLASCGYLFAADIIDMIEKGPR
ncbi:phosphotransferase family protein [Gordonia sp. zg691]|uniref:phosphotransferase family protein n=1 Tax=Gordonia jinghuaiqii TaxID=2758710 RepID=UPI001662205C|nr:phosphotransferase family protein [Gordonia jinghuaiqii]MBD0860340.1 phosphotransferase family protein [Gordonia jinghuaiqii]